MLKSVYGMNDMIKVVVIDMLQTRRPLNVNHNEVTPTLFTVSGLFGSQSLESSATSLLN